VSAVAQSLSITPAFSRQQRMSTQTPAWVATAAGAGFSLREIDLGPLRDDQVEVAVEHCGLCRSDLAMWRNEWGRSHYPFVGGHEVIGRVVQLGSGARGVCPGQRVGIGWISHSCLACEPCRGGALHQCETLGRLLIDGVGGFAARVRAHWAWVFPLPDGLPAAEAGPLFCAGITVFHPIAQFVRPVHRVAVVGIGGLGHLAVQFLRAFGCEVVAFVQRAEDCVDAVCVGAHQALPAGSDADVLRRCGPFDLVLVTTSGGIDLQAFVGALGHRGRLHVLGVGSAPAAFSADELMGRGASFSASAIGSPAHMLEMLRFAERHRILPQVEHLPMSAIDTAMQRLEAGDVRYRLVLDADFD